MEKLINKLDFLKGYKTYIVVLAGIILSGLVAQGYLTENEVKIVQEILLFLGLGTIRMAVTRK